MSGKVPMTKEGHEKLTEELERLKTKDRHKVVKEIEIARAHGDLSENAEYHAAKEKQSFIEGRIQMIGDKLARAEVIDISKVPRNRVVFGVTIVLEDEETVDLLRKCMYLKLESKVLRSDYQSKKIDAKKAKVINYINHWKWNHDNVQELNKFDEWSFKKNVQFGMLINNFLISAYRELSDMVKTKGSEIKISQNDLTVLGRKIYVIYSKQQGKFNCISQFSDKDPHQDNLTLLRTSQHGQNEIFNVYMDNVTNLILKKSDVKEYFLHSSKSALGTLPWIILNKCYGPKTRLNIMNYQYGEDVNSLLEDLFSFFPPIDISKIDSQKLLHSAVKEKVYIVINFSIPRWSKEVKTVGIISRNNWGEMFFQEYSGKEGLNKAVDALKGGKFELLREVKGFYKVYIPKGESYTALLNQINNTLKKHVSFHFGAQCFYKHSAR